MLTAAASRPILARAAVLLAVGAAACAAGDSEGLDVFAGETWTLDGRDVRIGSVDDPVYAFQTVRQIALGPDGHLYSMHQNEGQIRRWTFAGAPAGTVGREGDGPGEFTYPLSIGFFGDSLWVMDLDGYDLTYFDLDGAFLGQVRPRIDLGTPGAAGPSPARPDRPLRDGTFIGRSPGWSDAIARGELTGSPVVHMAADGSSIQPMWTHPHQPHDILALLRDRGGTFTSQPFPDGVLTAVTDRGLLVVDRRVWTGEGPATFSLTLIGFTGDTLFSRALPYEPVPLDPARVDSAARATAERMHEFVQRSNPGQSLGDLERQIREATYAPAYEPPVKAIVVALDGSVWLQRSGAGEDGFEWWIVDGDGAPLGSATTPAGFTPHLVTAEHVWGVETDELDVNYIVRYRQAAGTGSGT